MNIFLASKFFAAILSIHRNSMKKIFIVLIFTLSQMGCAAFYGSRYNAVVKQTCVNQKHCFESIQLAINSAPDNARSPYRIFIQKGVYTEKIILTKNNLELVGEGKGETHLVFGDYAGKQLAPGQVLGTPGSATFTIKARDVRILHLTIENNFDFLKNDALANDNPQRITGSQAVALFIDAPSDKIMLRNVDLLGYQDTLFVDSGRSWFDKVLVSGNVDFIFGKANALFTDSEIKAVARGKFNHPHGFVTAPSTAINSDFGLTFLNCRLTRTSLVPDNSTALGRPWHPTTQFPDGRYADPNAVGKSVFINTWMDAHIMDDGWYSMSGLAKDGNRITFAPEAARFFEYKSVGPGASINAKHPQLSVADAERYTKEKILGDWQPH